MKTTHIMLFSLILLTTLVVCPLGAVETEQFISEYSSLAQKDCKVIQSGVGYDISQCPRHDAMEVFINDDEGTSSVSVKVKGKEVTLDCSSIHPEGGQEFSLPYVAGDKLEWRYRVTGGKKELVGVIYRLADNGWKEGVSVLFVSRYDGGTFCPVAAVKSNKAAQKALDAGAPCAKK